MASDEEFAALCDVLVAPELASDARFAEAPTRWANADDLDGALAEHTSAHDREELFHALEAAGVTAAPVHDELDALASEQLAARDWFEEIDYPGVGKHRYPGLLFRMQNTPNAVRTPPPKLGEHSREIYLDLLGYSEEEYADLEARVRRRGLRTRRDPATARLISCSGSRVERSRHGGDTTFVKAARSRAD